MSTLGSGSGHDASASTRPVSTSTTAAAPDLCLASAASVAFCRSRSIDVTRSLPGSGSVRCGPPRSASSSAESLALPLGVDDDALDAVLAAQERLPLPLEPGAPDRVAEVIVERVGALPLVGQLLGRDLVHVAEHVRGERAVRVVAMRHRLHGDAGQIVLLRLEQRQLIARDVLERGELAEAIEPALARHLDLERGRLIVGEREILLELGEARRC